MAENEIISRIVQGEKELYAILVRRCNQRLYRIAMSIINDDSEAEDLMQSAYIKAFENLEKFAFRSSLATWLTRILINESLLRLKQRKKLSTGTLENELTEQSMASTQTPHMKLLNTELKGILEKSISQLPEKYRTVFVMREIENMNVEETKECLAISESNVKVRLNRARVMLKDLLSAYYKKEDILHFYIPRCNLMVDAVMSKI